MKTKINTLDRSKKNIQNLKLLLKEFELAYNLGPKMEKEQVSKLWEKFQFHLEECLKELLEPGYFRTDEA